MKSEPKLAKTVGELIIELDKLPHDLKLGESMRPVHYNKTEQAIKLRMKQSAGFENY